MVGPEAFAVDSNGNMYTGLADGRIVVFNDTGYETVVRMGQPPYDQCGKRSNALIPPLKLHDYKVSLSR